MTKILFVCSENVDRSPTAERIFSERPGLLVKSAGTSLYARTPLSADLIKWADLIFCMEKWHKMYIEKEYADLISPRKIENLDVPNVYPYMNPTLIEIIKRKTEAKLFEYQLKN